MFSVKIKNISIFKVSTFIALVSLGRKHKSKTNAISFSISMTKSLFLMMQLWKPQVIKPKHLASINVHGTEDMWVSVAWICKHSSVGLVSWQCYRFLLQKEKEMKHSSSTCWVNLLRSVTWFGHQTGQKTTIVKAQRGPNMFKASWFILLKVWLSHNRTVIRGRWRPVSRLVTTNCLKKYSSIIFEETLLSIK